MKNILITGGSRGIGYGLVNKFLQNGYHVFAISRNINPLLALTNTNKYLTVIQADITHGEDQQKILQSVSMVHEISIISNAAYAVPVVFSNTNMSEIRQHFETNVFAPLQLIQGILRQNKVNRVLNISSAAAELALPSFTSYCASKAAIHHAIKCLNLEYPDTKFANLGPAMVDTPLQQQLREYDDSVFPAGNPYVQAQKDKQLLSITAIADFIFSVFNKTPDEFAAKDWNINGT